jgi:hypothetical protein
MTQTGSVVVVSSSSGGGGGGSNMKMDLRKTRYDQRWIKLAQ